MEEQFIESTHIVIMRFTEVAEEQEEMEAS
jgi:hypothetical protein